MKKLPALDYFLLAVCAVVLATYYLKLVPADQAEFGLAIVGFAGLVVVCIGAVQGIWNFKLTADLLAAIALAFCLLNSNWQAAVLINAFLAVSRLLNNGFFHDIAGPVSSLQSFLPALARVRVGNRYLTKPVAELVVDDIVLVEAGSLVPADGVVVKGEANISQEAFTGEGLPVTIQVGDEVVAGAKILSGSVQIKVQTLAGESLLFRIITLLDNPHPNNQRLLSQLALVGNAYILILLAVAIVVYLQTHNIQLLISLLLVTSSSGITLAAPKIIGYALQVAAGNGVIIKGSRFITSLAHASTLVLDKSGVLTQGRLRVSGFHTLMHGYNQTEVLQLGAGLTSRCELPIAKAVYEYVKALKLPPGELEHPVEQLAGFGLLAKHHNKYAFIGAPESLQELDIVPTDYQSEEIAKFTNMGYSVAVLTYAKRVLGIFTVRDELKPEAAEAVAQLKALGISDTIMLTEDNQVIAHQLIQRAGITHYKSDLTPEDKLEYLQTNIAKRLDVLLVTTGVEDEYAFSQVDVGVAMDVLHTQAAVDSADILILQDSLWKLPQAKQLAEQTITVIRLNLGVWAVMNLLGILIVIAGVFTAAAAAAFSLLASLLAILIVRNLKQFAAFRNK